MTRYEVYFSSAAARQLRKLEERQRKRVLHAVRGLSEDPRPPGVKALRGRVGYRIRIGDHRVLYTVDDGVIEVWVVKVGHRRDVYE
ncbi:type II toxin-antitoxin system RelE/ParE family toxin [Nocardiopsis sp. NPDC006832]|uniref:type II toxin-antitoxin system RelE family toxin n=1 Tax=Nocardiopsis sp. NPDC006832 TaxID=3157188 RepID=UPI0033F5545D